MAKRLVWIPLLLFVISMMIRTYNIHNFLFFGFEQGLDAQRVHSIIKLEDFRLVGTKTDIDGVFQGGWWYYLLVIPYLLGGGNPVAAAIFMAVLNSLAVVAVYFFAVEFLKSKPWGLIAGLLATVSFDFITYSRWITINDPALPLVVISFWVLWKFINTPKQGWWFILFALSASFAAQFQIILIFSYGFVLAVLLATRILPVAKAKDWLLATLASGTLFIPYLIFNLRNQWITVTSAIAYLQGGNDRMVYKPSLLESLKAYGHMFTRLIEHTFSASREIEPRTYLIVGFLIIGTLILFLTQKKLRRELTFLLVWVFMSLPLLFFTQALSLDQLYIGTSAGLILLITFISQQFFKSKHLVLKSSLVLVAVVILIGAGFSLKSVATNKGYYFITTLDGMNFKDELAVIDTIYEAGKNENYRLEPFTIPYYSPNAWEYLHSWRYPNKDFKHGDVIYIIIQPNVEAYWQKEWIKTLKANDLVWEKQIGEIKIEKRNVVPDQ